MKIHTSEYQTPQLTEVGGKGYNLFRLKKLGLAVPPFAVMDQNVLVQIIPDQLKTPDQYEQIRNFIDTYSFPDDWQEPLTRHFGDLNHLQFAVRSSAIQEDGKNFSFAGQFESYLYVSASDLPEMIKKVWKSNFSERVIAYHTANQITPQFGIAVVIQQMIDPDVSGVGFGINPQSGEKDSKVICAVYGVGEGLVSGALNADTYTLKGSEIETDLVCKDKAARRSESGKIHFEPIDEHLQNQPSLTIQQIQEIAAILDQLEKATGHPQDIEFALKDNQIYLLQTRPITAIAQSVSVSRDHLKNRIIWDNSNIVESYPGVTTPLTFSYIKTAYKNVYMQLALLMGASNKTVKENEAVFANMLGLINGRVYYNLLSWYKVLALFPGYSLNARFMENMMGVKERFVLEKDTTTSKLTALYRTGIMLTKIMANTFTIRRKSDRFLADVNEALDRVKALDVDQMTAYELKKTWIDLDAELTPKWQAPVINDSFAMIYFGRLQKLISRYKITENPNLQNDLLCGSKDIISVEPIRQSLSLATEIGKDDELRKLFIDHEPTAIQDHLTDHPFRKKIDTYIQQFGDRCVGELKLETVSYKQDPTLFIATLKAFVRQNVTTASTESTIDQDLRIAAEKAVKKALKYKPYKRYRFFKTLKKTRYFVSNRENLRYERTRVFGITRELFVAIGKRFEKAGVLAHHRDIFYLTQQEVFDFIDGTSVTNNLKALVRLRQQEFESYTNSPTPADRITTYETVNHGNDFFSNTSTDQPQDTLKGLGCCPGIVQAQVCVVNHPGEIESLNGSILVTTSTDPGWVTLFPTASGIIVERGSLLSHSAIVSREMGIPCIVSVTDLLKQVKTGDWIEMDGSTGTIKRLTNAS